MSALVVTRSEGPAASLGILPADVVIRINERYLSSAIDGNDVSFILGMLTHRPVEIQLLRAPENVILADRSVNVLRVPVPVVGSAGE